MRDARINTIGEGANEVLLAFIAAVGMRDEGLGLKATLEGLKMPSRSSARSGRSAATAWAAWFARLMCRVSTPELRPLATSWLAGLRGSPGPWIAFSMTHREAVIRRQLVLERVARQRSPWSPRRARWPASTRSSPPRATARRSRGRRTLPPHGIPPLR